MATMQFFETMRAGEDPLKMFLSPDGEYLAIIFAYGRVVEIFSRSGAELKWSAVAVARREDDGYGRLISIVWHPFLPRQLLFVYPAAVRAISFTDEGEVNTHHSWSLGIILRNPATHACINESATELSLFVENSIFTLPSPFSLIFSGRMISQWSSVRVTRLGYNDQPSQAPLVLYEAGLVSGEGRVFLFKKGKALVCILNVNEFSGIEIGEFEVNTSRNWLSFPSDIPLTDLNAPVPVPVAVAVAGHASRLRPVQQCDRARSRIPRLGSRSTTTITHRALTGAGYGVSPRSSSRFLKSTSRSRSRQAGSSSASSSRTVKNGHMCCRVTFILGDTFIRDDDASAKAHLRAGCGRALADAAGRHVRPIGRDQGDVAPLNGIGTIGGRAGMDMNISTYSLGAGAGGGRLGSIAAGDGRAGRAECAECWDSGGGGFCGGCCSADWAAPSYVGVAQSRVKCMNLTLVGARELFFAQGHYVVECVSAVSMWMYRYVNGYTATLRGPLTVHAIIATMGSGLTSQTLKFEVFQFHANMHDKYIASDAIVGARTLERNHPRTFLDIQVIQAAATAADTVITAQQDEDRCAEPRIFIGQAVLPGEPANAYGIPQATMRCLELAESVSSVADLIEHAHDNKMGPMDALKRMTQHIRDMTATTSSWPVSALPVPAAAPPLPPSTLLVPFSQYAPPPTLRPMPPGPMPSAKLYSSAPSSVTELAAAAAAVAAHGYAGT
ncbi:hypothetical protein HYPSUDRAFT_209001 [Hypholoma sublateritium FD-334 SS-4]|uniref:Uncharacterized protein n=1 Tax=Hypholoma sublateritium (strain FD-334 SS-4) TaxID=945553 RepID=A0A0D2LTE5_HYPSF|nr:hypothetical protein HYPSUDRAFT_209001 [Hypholoma sublateritium FD-334 SS-4]